MTFTRNYSEEQRRAAWRALHGVFGSAWTNLPMDSKRRALLVQDFLETIDDENLTAREYYSRLGGACKAYGDVMIVRERKGWDAR